MAFSEKSYSLPMNWVAHFHNVGLNVIESDTGSCFEFLGDWAWQDRICFYKLEDGLHYGKLMTSFAWGEMVC